MTDNYFMMEEKKEKPKNGNKAKEDTVRQNRNKEDTADTGKAGAEMTKRSMEKKPEMPGEKDTGKKKEKMPI
jgi:hypothetical protein